MEIPRKKLILYGAGAVGKYMGAALAVKDIPIECFCDRDEKKHGTTCCGIPVKSIRDVKQCYPRGTFLIFVTIGEPVAEQVKKDFIAQGIFEAGDFYDKRMDPFGIVALLQSFSTGGFCWPEVEPSLKENFIFLDAEREETLKKSLFQYYFHVNSYDDFASDEERTDFSNHLYVRVNNDRKRIIPWLNSIQTLRDASILEIGCGTGTSTVPLCEQKADVTAIDVSEESIEVTKTRLRLYGLRAEVLLLNACDLLLEFPDRKFDFILFFASLEHMTFAERIQSIKAAYEILKPGGHLVLVEIPNRLWYIDGHTSWEPFFHWLPDELAMEYAKFTRRPDFNKGFDPNSREDALRFARWGRGVSYHELEVALGGREHIRVDSSMRSYYHMPDHYFKKVLRLVGPEDVHEGFYEDPLCMSITKI